MLPEICDKTYMDYLKCYLKYVIHKLSNCLNTCFSFLTIKMQRNWKNKCLVYFYLFTLAKLNCDAFFETSVISNQVVLEVKFYYIFLWTCLHATVMYIRICWTGLLYNPCTNVWRRYILSLIYKHVTVKLFCIIHVYVCLVFVNWNAVIFCFFVFLTKCL